MTGGREAKAASERIALDAQLEFIRTMLATGQRPPAGQLLGLPDLDGDVWADIAGAAAITGAPPPTITGWLNRQGPKRCPFPEPRRSLYRLYWRQPRYCRAGVGMRALEWCDTHADALFLRPRRSAVRSCP